jgi:hypothetical protein
MYVATDEASFHMYKHDRIGTASLGNHDNRNKNCSQSAMCCQVVSLRNTWQVYSWIIHEV